MIHVVSFSGGRTSAYLVHLMEQRRIKEDLDVRYIYMDTGAEHPKTYEFIKNVVSHWDINLTCLRVVVNPELGQGNSYEVIPTSEIKHDLEPWKAIVKKYGLPYPAGAFCTREMKFNPVTKYCKDNFDEYTTWIGIRVDEQNRLKQKDGINYLADISDFEKDDINHWWSKQPFDLNIPEHLGNCVFCIKKSVNKIALAARDEPILAKQFIDVINGDVREVNREQQSSQIMFRGNNSLEGIIALFKNHTRDEIANVVKGSGGYKSGSCSESCEAFNCQLDLPI
ncbi:TPA: phosphoadenosine phosphosulfate reductase family protein [Providencia alcalifaciens]